LHLSNDAVNYFDTRENPVGICCGDLEELADKMADIINNYSSYRGNLRIYRENILALREQISIAKSVPTIKNCFTFD
jgi:hypothetical protein